MENIFTKEDINYINSRGISIEKIQQHLDFFKQGIPKITLVRSATINDGIYSFAENEVDFFVDFLFDLELSKTWYLRGGFGHTSQHLADDAVLSGTIPKNYVKDYGLFHSIHKLAKNKLTLYEGIYYFDNFKIGDSVPLDWSKKIMLQVGGEYQFLKLSTQSFLYTAADVKFRQEFNFGTTQNIQLGYVSQTTTQRKFRFAYNFLSG